MKIAFLNIYNGVIDRGAETFVKELAQRLSNRHDVFVLQGGEEQDFEKYKVVKVPIKFDWNKKSGVSTLTAFLFLDYWNRLIAIFALKSIPIIWREKFDVVVPVNGGWLPAIMRLITWLYGGKMVISGQSGIGWDDRNNLWCFPNIFVALSTKAKDWAKRVNPLARIEYIPNGVDISKFSPVGKKRKFSLERPIILCVAALTPSKRVELAIESVMKLEKGSLLVVGDGDSRDKIYNLGKKLLGERFQLIKVPYERMPEVYRSADVFTIPSQSFYSFEIVLVEAMATNLPVVANDDPIRREIVGEAGILVDPTDTKAYARALEEALRTNWTNKPRKQAEKFSWDTIAEKYEKLFKDLS